MLESVRLARWSLAAVTLLALGACRQIAGLRDLEPPPATDASSDTARPPSDDGGLGCSCPGCTILASGTFKPQSLVATGGYVYWLVPGTAQEPPGNGSLWRVPTRGGTSQTLTTAGTFADFPLPPSMSQAPLLAPLSIATDGANLYFLETGAGSLETGEGSIDQVAVATSGSASLHKLVEELQLYDSWSPPTNPSACGNGASCADTTILNVAGDELYFSSAGAGTGNAVAIERVPTQGGAVRPVVGSLTNDAADQLPTGDAGSGPDPISPYAFAIADSDLYWLNSDLGGGCPCAGGIGTQVGCAGLNHGFSLWRVPAGGGDPFHVTRSELSAPDSLVVVGSFAFVADIMNNDIERIPTSGGAEMPVAGGQSFPWGLITDGAYLYWANLGGEPDDGAIARLSLANAEAANPSAKPEVLASNLAAPVALAVDDENIYWVDTVCDAILKVPK
jgi:hypothetical protein